MEIDTEYCNRCEEKLDSLKWEMIDGRGFLYGYSCDGCAEGAFDNYMESRIG
jgi:hypothetical protein